MSLRQFCEDLQIVATSLPWHSATEYSAVRMSCAEASICKAGLLAICKAVPAACGNSSTAGLGSEMVADTEAGSAAFSKTYRT